MEKLPVGILGATGMVGQRMVERLANHPWFQVSVVGASSRSVGKSFAQAASWRLAGHPDPAVASLEVALCSPESFRSVRLVFSALDSSVAGDIEASFRNEGFAVVSNAGNHRMDPLVPLVVPEINPDHLELVKRQPGSGYIVTNPNCCAIPVALALAPLHERWRVQAVTCATYQAVSGAGYPGESAWDMVGSVHPHPGAEEHKLAVEPQKILGSPTVPADFGLSARCVRVPVADGHLVAMHIRLDGDPGPDEVAQAIGAWAGHAPPLPSSPQPLFHISTRRDRPSPRFDVDAGNSMAATVGRVERCAVMGIKLYVLTHNTVRGAAGAAIANAELLRHLDLLPS